jgi:adenylyltransferase/sulfurtransferase
LFPDPPPGGSSETCDTAGIIAPAATIVASLQTLEALKILVGAEQEIRRSLLSIDLWPFRVFEMGGPHSAPQPDCPCCGRREFPFLKPENAGRAMVHCGRDAVFITPAEGSMPFDFDRAVERLRGRFPTRESDGVAHWTLPEGTLTLFQDGRALISGMNDQDRARALYDRYIGG